MPTQKHEEIQTSSFALGKAGESADLYRRHDKHMDRSLLLREVGFANKALIHAIQSGILLDLCCGVGEVSLMLHTSGLRSLGLDMNPLALNQFRQHSQEVRLIQGDALHLPFCSGSLDAIVPMHCFDLLDRVKFLQECSRVLRSGGLLIFDALNRHSYKLILKKLDRFLGLRISGSLNDRWIDVFSFGEVLQSICQAGLNLQIANGYGWAPFLVDSDSRLVNVTTAIERILRLNRYPNISPRNLIVVKK